jgi:hypothetical protein
MPDGSEFVASIESDIYPFFGTQFHPEKANEVFIDVGINHSWTSIVLNRHFADFFVYHTRYNPNKWGDFKEIQKNVI